MECLLVAIVMFVTGGQTEGREWSRCAHTAAWSKRNSRHTENCRG